MKNLPKPERMLEILRSVAGPITDGRYQHWDELKYRKPPEGLTREDWWFGLKFHRQTGNRPIPLKDAAGNDFRFSVPDLVADLLHQIDRGGGTFVEIPEQVTSAEHRDRYVV